MSTPHLTASRRARNPLLTGLQCLRCDALFPLLLLHGGCPACAKQGVYVSLRAAYNRQAGLAHYLPYGFGTQLGEGSTPLTAAPGLARTLRDSSQQINGDLLKPDEGVPADTPVC